MMKPAMKRRDQRIALLAGTGVLVVAVLAGLYREKLAAWARFVYLFESIGPNEQGYPEYRHRQTGIVMMRVPGGTFTMGSPSREEGRNVTVR
jgi:formylglycine-generating enzyme required for sulfatase activity